MARLRSVVSCCVVLAARSQCHRLGEGVERLIGVADAGLQRAIRHDAGAFDVTVVDRASVSEGISEVGEGAV
jgi:hypothetical protein